MIDQIITVEVGQLAKDKGFDVETKYNYCQVNGTDRFVIDWSESELNYNRTKNQISAPTQSLLQRWLREKHQIDIDMCTTYSRKYAGMGFKGKSPECAFTTDDFDTYEEALEAALEMALKLIKTENGE